FCTSLNKCNRSPQIMTRIGGELLHLFERGLNTLQHRVQCSSQALNFVSRPLHAYPGGEIGWGDFVRGARDLVHWLHRPSAHPMTSDSRSDKQHRNSNP